MEVVGCCEARRLDFLTGVTLVAAFASLVVVLFLGGCFRAWELIFLACGLRAPWSLLGTGALLETLVSVCCRDDEDTGGVVNAPNADPKAEEGPAPNTDPKAEEGPVPNTEPKAEAGPGELIAEGWLEELGLLSSSMILSSNSKSPCIGDDTTEFG